MSALAHIGFICEGDAEAVDQAWSGCAHRIVVALRAVGHRVTTIDCDLYGPHRVLAAVRSFSFDKTKWKARFHVGAAGFESRSDRAAAGLRGIRDQVDVILQVGALFRPPGHGRVPYFLYCDWSMGRAIANQSSPFSQARHIPAAIVAEAKAREAMIYCGARAVFTLSEALREAFMADYGLPRELVVAARPGPNLDESLQLPKPQRPVGQPPTVVFVGKEFLRKGGDVLLEAFRTVRLALPEARLLIAGPAGPLDLPAGVELLGILHKDVPHEYERLLNALRSADVFCFPTRYEPFGIVVLEAMSLGVACATSDHFAVPEMVQDGVTGLVAPAGDAPALAERLIRLLRDPDLAARMGAAGRQRQREHFTWEGAARVISAVIEARRTNRAPGQTSSAHPLGLRG